MKISFEDLKIVFITSLLLLACLLVFDDSIREREIRKNQIDNMPYSNKSSQIDDLETYSNWRNSLSDLNSSKNKSDSNGGQGSKSITQDENLIFKD